MSCHGNLWIYVLCYLLLELILLALSLKNGVIVLVSRSLVCLFLLFITDLLRQLQLYVVKVI